MLFGFNLNHLLTFPFQGQEARKYFFIGCLIYLAGFFIPILPWLIVTGYNAILIRQALNGEQPHLVPWDNWETLFKDGARLLGVRLIYISPILLFLAFIMLGSFAIPFLPDIFQQENGRLTGIAALLFMLVIIGGTLLIMPLSLVVGLLVPVAEIHMLAQDRFEAGFQVKEWWPIFKKNWAGFVVALAILYGMSMAMSVVMQIMMFTIVLLCLLPFFLPVISMYAAVVQYAAFAQAYKEGRERFSRGAIAASTPVAPDPST